MRGCLANVFVRDVFFFFGNSSSLMVLGLASSPAEVHGTAVFPVKRQIFQVGRGMSHPHTPIRFRPYAAVGGVEELHLQHLACRQICSTPIVDVDVVLVDVVLVDVVLVDVVLVDVVLVNVVLLIQRDGSLYCWQTL